MDPLNPPHLLSGKTLGDLAAFQNQVVDRILNTRFSYRTSSFSANQISRDVPYPKAVLHALIAHAAVKAIRSDLSPPYNAKAHAINGRAFESAPLASVIHTAMDASNLAGRHFLHVASPTIDVFSTAIRNVGLDISRDPSFHYEVPPQELANGFANTIRDLSRNMYAGPLAQIRKRCNARRTMATERLQFLGQSRGEVDCLDLTIQYQPAFADRLNRSDASREHNDFLKRLMQVARSSGVRQFWHISEHLSETGYRKRIRLLASAFTLTQNTSNAITTAWQQSTQGTGLLFTGVPARRTVDEVLKDALFELNVQEVFGTCDLDVPDKSFGLRACTK